MCDLLLIREMFLRDRGEHEKDVREVLQFLTMIDLVFDFIAQPACRPRLDMGPVRLVSNFDSPNVLVVIRGRLPRGILLYIRFSKLRTDYIPTLHF